MKKHAIIISILSVLFIVAIVLCTKPSVLAQTNEYDIGKMHFDQQRYPQAISQLEKLLKDYPNFGEKSKVWFYLGVSYVELAKGYRTTNPSQARQNGLKAIEYFTLILGQKDANGNVKVDDPFFPDTIFYMGQIFYFEGERHLQTGDLQKSTEAFQEAKSFFEQLLAQYPNYSRVPEALDRLGFMAIYNKNPTDAKKYYSEAIDKTTDPELRNRCIFYNAWAIAQLGDKDQAIRIFNTFVYSSDAKFGAPSLYEIANIEMSRQAYQKVILQVDALPRTFPGVKTTTDPALLGVWHDAQVLQVDAYEKLGQYNEAAKVMEDVVLELSRPGHPIAGKLVSDKFKLFNLFLAQKNFNSASNLLRNDLEKNAGIDADEIKLLYAKLYDAQNQNGQALSVLTDLLGAQANWTGQFQISKSPNIAGSTSLSVKSFYDACKLLAVCYAKSNQMNNANTVLTFMYDLQRNSTYDYWSIIDEASQEVVSITSGSSGSGLVSTPYPGGSSGSGLVGQQMLPPGAIQTGHSNISPLAPEVKPNEVPTSELPKLTPREQQSELARFIRMIAAGKDKEVEPQLEQFFLNDANSPGNRAVAGLQYGKILLEQGNKTEAYTVFELVSSDEYSSTSESREAAYYLGLGAENDGDAKTARTYYLDAVQRSDNKQYDAALYRLASLELADYDKSSGMKRLEEIFKNYPDGTYWSHAAWALVLDIYDSPSPDIKQAEEILDEMLTNKVDMALLDRVLFLKGRIAQEQEHWETAALAYETLVNLKLSSPLDSEAKRALNECRDKVTRN